MAESGLPMARRAYLLRVVESLSMAAGMCVVLVIAFATWSPPELRPTSDYGSGGEHFAAFALIGLFWGIAFPRRAFQVMIAITLIAAVLEAGQIIVPDRHARLSDLVTKIAGCGTGILVAHFLRRVATWLGLVPGR